MEVPARRSSAARPNDVAASAVVRGPETTSRVVSSRRPVDSGTSTLVPGTVSVARSVPGRAAPSVPEPRWEDWEPLDPLPRALLALPPFLEDSSPCRARAARTRLRSSRRRGALTTRERAESLKEASMPSPTRTRAMPPRTREVSAAPRAEVMAADSASTTVRTMRPTRT